MYREKVRKGDAGEQGGISRSTALEYMADDKRYDALPLSGAGAVPPMYRERVRKGDAGEQGGIMRSTALQYMADDKKYNALPAGSVPEDIQELFQGRKISATAALKCIGDRSTYATLVGNGRVPADLCQLVSDNKISVPSALKRIALLADCARLCEAFDGLAMLQTIPMDTSQLNSAAVDEVAPPWVASDMPTPEEIAQSALAQDRARSKLEWTTFQEAASSRLYYHNAIRGVTQWERPECLG
jgi:hypothetical protein